MSGSEVLFDQENLPVQHLRYDHIFGGIGLRHCTYDDYYDYDIAFSSPCMERKRSSLSRALCVVRLRQLRSSTYEQSAKKRGQERDCGAFAEDTLGVCFWSLHDSRYPLFHNTNTGSVMSSIPTLSCSPTLHIFLSIGCHHGTLYSFWTMYGTYTGWGSESIDGFEESCM